MDEPHSWRCPPHLWGLLKPLAREKRHRPTPAEDRLWQQLRNRQVLGRKFRRQHAIERFIVDFYSRGISLVIEVDGGIHQYTQEQDALRQSFLEWQGLRVIRFTNEQVLFDMESVLQEIEEASRKPRPPRYGAPSAPL